MHDNKLGKFFSSVTIDGSRFYVRGLTVGEYCDLIFKMQSENIVRDGEQWAAVVAVTGLVGWEDVFDEASNRIEYSEELKEYLPDEVYKVIAEKVFYSLTALSEEERAKFEASIRFLYFSSEKKNEKIAETFNCATCIKKGLAKTRPCGKFSKEEIDQIGRQLREEGENVPETPVKAPKDVKSKYKTSNKRVRTSAEKEGEEPTSRKEFKDYMTLDGYKYPECPVSYVDDWISVLSSMLYHAGKSNLTFFDGGVVDQPYKLLQAQKVVSSEASKIESEEMDKQFKNNKNSKGRK
jgi:prepilin-type processing-associated H-X9-DG protein